MTETPSAQALDYDAGNTPLAHLAHRDLVTVTPETWVAEAARRMRAAGCGSVVVCHEGEAVGIWTEGDALRLDLADPGSGHRPLQEVMSAPVASLAEEATADEAQARMIEGGMRHLLVTDPDQRPVGVISQTDLVANHGLEAYLRLREVHTALPGDFLRLPADRPLSQAAAAMAAAGQPAAVVDFNDGGEPGLVTERDVVRILAEEAGDLELAQAASRPLISVDAEESLLAAWERMRGHGIRRIGVTDGNDGLVGLVGFADLLATSERGLIQRLEQALADTRAELRNARQEQRVQEQETVDHYERQYRPQLEHYKAIFDTLPVGVFRSRPEAAGTFEEVNPAMARLFGAASPEELLQHTPADLFADADQRQGFRDTLIENGEVQRYEANMRTLGGRPLRAAISARVRHTPEGEPYFDGVVEDVTDRHEEEAFRRQLLDSLAEGVFGIDRDGAFTFLNPTACAMLGIAEEGEALRRSAHALTHHHRRDGSPLPEAECPILRVMEQGRPLEAWEDWFWRRDGSGFPVEVYAAPLHDAEGRPEGAVVSFQDISRRQAAEAARDRVLAILDATPDVVSIADAEGNLVYINRAGLALLEEDTACTGLTRPLPQRLQGAKAGDTFHPEWARQLIRHEGTPTAKQDGVWQGETAIFDARGHEIPVSQVILAHPDEFGELAYFSTILRDVSAQRALEAELRRETTFSQAIIRNLPGIFYLISAEGRFVRWNRRLATVTGYEGDQALAEVHPTELYPEEERGLIAERMEQVFQEGSTTAEAHLCHRDGTLSPYYLTGFRVELEGEPYLLGVGLDISERRAMETELERSNAELEAFAYAVSHDLQEPLRIINSYLGLLQRRYSDALDERAGRYIATTTDAAERMRRMIADLLEYSRIKRMGEEFRPVDLNAVATEARANLETAIADSGAEIQMDELPTVQGDHAQLVRLLQNLLSNAIKYGPTDDVPRITVSAERDDGHWAIAVADNGLGIDPGQAERVFGVFQRLHTRDEHEGTGAGLALAQRIVERHGGRIWVESAGEGCGSTFRFTLPAAERPQS